eukprot:COSAG04_NODE_9310_length_876_cov_0.687259_2_plen_159_part_00
MAVSQTAAPAAPDALQRQSLPAPKPPLMGGVGAEPSSVRLAHWPPLKSRGAAEASHGVPPILTEKDPSLAASTASSGAAAAAGAAHSASSKGAAPAAAIGRCDCGSCAPEIAPSREPGRPSGGGTACLARIAELKHAEFEETRLSPESRPPQPATSSQ